MPVKYAAFFPDDRTVVLHEEAAIRGLIDRLAAGTPAPKPAGWDRVEQSEFVLAFDCTDRRWLEKRKALKKTEDRAGAQMVAFLTTATSLTADLNGGERSRGRLFVKCQSSEGAAAVLGALKVGHAAIADELSKKDKESGADRADVPESIRPLFREAHTMLNEFVRSATAETVGSEVQGMVEVPGDALLLYLRATFWAFDSAPGESVPKE
jgi:hypothetical protein